jgi:hypothetical protein
MASFADGIYIKYFKEEIMKKGIALIFTLSLITFYTSTIWGAGIGAGARAIGMGGAYTAVADDVYAPYWNPAGIVQTRHFGLSFGAGFQGDLTKLTNVSDALSNNEMPDEADMNQSYLLTGYLGFTTKYFALSGYGDLQFNTVTDANQNIAMGTNLTSVNYGLVTVAFYAGENLAIGINLKSVLAGYGEITQPNLPDITTCTTVAEVQSKVDAYNLNGGATTSYTTGTGTACDIGALYKLTPEITLGFIARNAFVQIDQDEGSSTHYLLQPNTSDPDSNNWTVDLVGQTPTSYNHSIEIPKAYVVGLAYWPSETTLLAVDVESITNTSNDQTRIHVGLEQTALWDVIALRLGCFTNKGEPLVYTGGLGFKLWAISTNVAYVKENDSQIYMITGDLLF